jgi:hypothetical protein
MNRLSISPFCFGNGASTRAAKGLIAAKDSKQQLAHLRIFARRRFPLDVHAHLPLADIEENRVGFAAMRALTHLVQHAARDLAFRLVAGQARSRGDAISLLASITLPETSPSFFAGFRTRTTTKRGTRSARTCWISGKGIRTKRPRF